MIGKIKLFRLMSAISLLLASGANAEVADEKQADIVIYGCTSAGVIAAIEARRLGRSVLLVCRDAYVGGMTTNGLG